MDCLSTPALVVAVVVAVLFGGAVGERHPRGETLVPWPRPYGRQHLGFVALHVQPSALAQIVPGFGWSTAALVYALAVVGAVAVLAIPLALRRPVAFAITVLAAAVALTAFTGASTVAWFPPTLLVKLLLGHLLPEEAMRLDRPPRTTLQRAVARAPIWLYRLGLGGLLGHRFVLLTHTGRKSGRPRQVVLEVVGRHEESGGYLIASGYGTRSQWFRNILADPRVRFQVGWRRYTGLASPLPAAESGRRLAEYARRHPRTAAALMRAIGQAVDGSAAAYARVGSDPDHGVPLVALIPR